METNRSTDTKITIGQLTFWTRPWCDGKAMLTANEAGTNRFLYNVHREHPEIFEILQDDADFCAEDLDGTFSVIVDPERVHLLIGLGNAGIGFRVAEEYEEEEQIGDE